MRLSRLRSFLLAIAPALAVAAAFWVPAREAARGWFPSPLDDVYIHFDFARSLATGHPFEWLPGQGYSSGETAPLYAVIPANRPLPRSPRRGLGARAPPRIGGGPGHVVGAGVPRAGAPGSAEVIAEGYAPIASASDADVLVGWSNSWWDVPVGMPGPPHLEMAVLSDGLWPSSTTRLEHRPFLVVSTDSGWNAVYQRYTYVEEAPTERSPFLIELRRDGGIRSERQLGTAELPIIDLSVDRAGVALLAWSFSRSCDRFGWEDCEILATEPGDALLHPIEGGVLRDGVTAITSARSVAMASDPTSDLLLVASQQDAAGRSLRLVGSILRR